MCASVHVHAYGVFLRVVNGRWRDWLMCYDSCFSSFLYSRNTFTSRRSGLSHPPASKSHRHWHSSPAPLLITSDGQFPLKRGQIHCATEYAEGFSGSISWQGCDVEKEDKQDKLGSLISSGTIKKNSFEAMNFKPVKIYLESLIFFFFLERVPLQYVQFQGEQ